MEGIICDLVGGASPDGPGRVGRLELARALLSVCTHRRHGVLPHGASAWDSDGLEAPTLVTLLSEQPSHHEALLAARLRELVHAHLLACLVEEAAVGVRDLREAPPPRVDVDDEEDLRNFGLHAVKAHGNDLVVATALPRQVVARVLHALTREVTEEDGVHNSASVVQHDGGHIQIDLTLSCVPTETCGDRLDLRSLWQIDHGALLHRKGPFDSPWRARDHTPYKVPDSGLQDVNEVLAILSRYIHHSEHPAALGAEHSTNQIYFLTAAF
mmetsp:Transcript_34638/g.99537  ORF Transcript_34638/g.99537 Transcript_34638/m.99537 type:complete len:270 (-) Transcript_34638:503-1312(-)